MRDKEKLFGEINRVLKTNGLFLITDWIYSEMPTADDTYQLVSETQEGYLKLLKNAEFTNIRFRNDSNIFLVYINKLLSRANFQQEYIMEKFGEKVFSVILHDHLKLINEIQNKSKIAIRIKANKK